jgi:hypothetical protein
MSDCDDCTAKNIYRFDWRNVCCRVRFLLAQPNREARIQWIERWRKQGDHGITGAAIKRLKEMA